MLNVKSIHTGGLLPFVEIVESVKYELEVMPCRAASDVPTNWSLVPRAEVSGTPTASESTGLLSGSHDRRECGRKGSATAEDAEIRVRRLVSTCPSRSRIASVVGSIEQL